MVSPSYVAAVCAIGSCIEEIEYSYNGTFLCGCCLCYTMVSPSYVAACYVPEAG